ncbi:ferritin, heavy subunit-like [Myotis yumanensis]|uniref:ferritin, heavy subunit-like n=1 Tax=Myotis yumanensis TaxID=159337 RepID=UPI0038D0FCEE
MERQTEAAGSSETDLNPTLNKQNTESPWEIWEKRKGTLAEMEGKKPLCEECSVAVNKLASFKLHISDAYLFMAYNSLEDSVQSLFADFFENQADVKRENGKEFLKYLRKCGNTICLPVFKRPEIGNWGTGIKALECALELEDQLTKLLLDLKTTASVNKEYDLLCFLGKFLDEQEENTDNLKIQLRCRKRLENQAKKEKDPLKNDVLVVGTEDIVYVHFPFSMSDLSETEKGLRFFSTNLTTLTKEFEYLTQTYDLTWHDSYVILFSLNLGEKEHI